MTDVTNDQVVLGSTTLEESNFNELKVLFERKKELREQLSTEFMNEYMRTESREEAADVEDKNVETKVKISSDTIKSVEELKIPLNNESSDILKINSKPSSNKTVSVHQKDAGKCTSRTERSCKPEEARKFMKEQQIRWKQTEKENKLKQNTQRDEIQKRLKELHANSIKILKNNVKKSKSKSEKPPKQNDEDCTNAKTMQLNSKQSVSKIVKPMSNASSKSTSAKSTQLEKTGLTAEAIAANPSIKKSNEFSQQDANASNGSKTTHSTSSHPLTLHSNKNNSHQIVTPQMIGILRRSDDFIPNIDLNKENIPLNISLLDKATPTSGDKLLEKTLIAATKESQTQANSDKSEEYDLIIPDDHLKSSCSRSSAAMSWDKNLSKDRNVSQRGSNRSVPYWLRPTTVQPYPYNFIMAIRKKLERAVRPIIPVEETHKREEHQRPPTTPVARPKDERNDSFDLDFEKRMEHYSKVLKIESLKVKGKRRVKSRKSRNIAPIAEHTELVSDDHRTSTSSEMPTNSISSKKSSEMNTNFSSISLQVPESNTISDISSFASDFIHPVPVMSSTSVSKHLEHDSDSDHNTLSMSSGILSQSSPEKKKRLYKIDESVVSPLSTENISNLRVVSKTDVSFITKSRGDEFVDVETFPKPKKTGKDEEGSKEQKENKRLKIQTIAKPHKQDIAKNMKRKLSVVGEEPDTDRSIKTLELSKMLDAFNRTLTQVIEVNNQLHETLSKVPPHVSTSDKDIQVTFSRGSGESLMQSSMTQIESRRSNYSDDFEEAHDKTFKVDSTESNVASLSMEQADLLRGNRNDLNAFRKTEEASLSENLNSQNNSQNLEDVFTSKSNQNSENAKAMSAKDNSFTSQPVEEEVSSSVPSQQNVSADTLKTGSSIAYSSVEHQRLNSDSTILSNFDEVMSLPLSRLEDYPNVSYSGKTTTEITSKTTEIVSHQQEIISENESIRTNITIFQTRHHVSENEEAESVAGQSSSYSATELKPIGSFRRDIVSSSILENNSGNPSIASLNTTIGTDIFAVFNQSEMDASVVSEISGHNVSYSSLGMYEQLIKTETSKSDQLSGLLKMRERSLIDRTKGQIAWLELQKQKYKERGMSTQISAIRKKQRAILMRLEKERTDIQKQLKLQNEVPSTARRSLLSNDTPKVALRRIQRSTEHHAVKGFEIQGGDDLEKMLQKREDQLRERRQQVERLIQWHQRLDDEEKEVFEMEATLMRYTKMRPAIVGAKSEDNIIESRKMKKLRSIEKSLKALQNVSVSSMDGDSDLVQVSGGQMNKLWKRLTGKIEEKFSPDQFVSLTKEDLEKIYEDAKLYVMTNFERKHKLGDLLEDSKLHTSRSITTSKSSDTLEKNEHTVETSYDSNENGLPKTRNHKNIEIVSEDRKVESDTNSELFELNLQNIKGSTAEASISISVNIKDKTDSDTDASTPIEAAQSIGSKDMEEAVISELNLSFFDSESNISANTVEDPISSRSVTEEQSSSRNEIPIFQFGNEISLKEELEMSEKLSKEKVIESISGDSEYLVHNFHMESAKENSSESRQLYSEMDELSDITQSHLSKTDAIPEMSACMVSDIGTMSFIDESNLNQEIHNFEVIEDLSLPQHNSTLETTVATVIDVANSISDDQLQKNDYSSDKREEFDDKYLSDEFERSQTDKNISDDKTNEALQTQAAVSASSSSSSPTPSSPIAAISLSSVETGEPLIIREEISGVSALPDTQGHEDIVAQPTKGKELEQRLIDLDDSLKDLNSTLDKASVMEMGGQHSRSPSPPVVQNENVPLNEAAEGEEASVRNFSINSDLNKMPDIISEAEVLRRQQLQIEKEIKQLEENAPLVFLREIPNKPPPPYVPPAHGSPMTTIFPSDERIKDIVNRRTKELYNFEVESSAGSHSILDENITNVYEQIILDLCQECVSELTPPVGLTSNPIERYSFPLSLYSPPNRLETIQQHVLKRVTKLLCGRPTTRLISGNLGNCTRRKRDLVDEILIQQLHEEDHKWTNFDLEETEVKIRIVEEIANILEAKSMEETEAFEDSHCNSNST